MNTAKTDGYMAGVRDARTHRYPEHSKTHYRFPVNATIQEQRDYNDGYYEARYDMARANELNAKWFAEHQEEI